MEKIASPEVNNNVVGMLHLKGALPNRYFEEKEVAKRKKTEWAVSQYMAFSGT
jgi:hypothetical protein